MCRNGRTVAAVLASALPLTLAVASAAAQRSVAVVNAAADDQLGSAAAARIRAQLAADPDLAPIETGNLARALEGPLPAADPAIEAIAAARRALTDAQDAMGQFETQRGIDVLIRAQEQLISIAPTDEVVSALADVQFQLGLLHLRDQNRGLAVDSFRLLHRLSPDRAALDAARFLPVVVEAFEEARKPLPTDATLNATAAFDGVTIYLDGKSIGKTPLTRPIAVGPHIITAAVAGHQPKGERLRVASNQSVERAIELERLPSSEQAYELRHGFGRKGGAGDAAQLARRVAGLATVDAVLIVAQQDGELRVAAYDGRDDRVSVFRPIDSEVSDLFGLLVPTAMPGPADLLVPIASPEPAPWWRPWVAPTSIGVALLTLAGVALLTNDQTDPLPRQGLCCEF